MPCSMAELCRENPAVHLAARLLPRELALTWTSLSGWEPGQHHHADTEPLMKQRQSFPSPHPSPRAPWIQPASRTTSLLCGDAQLGPPAAPYGHTPPPCPYLRGCKHVRLRPVNPNWNLSTGGAELLEEAAVGPDPQVIFSDLHLSNRGQTSTTLCHAKPPEEHLGVGPELYPTSSLLIPKVKIHRKTKSNFQPSKQGLWPLAALGLLYFW